MSESEFAALRYLPWVRQGAAAEFVDGASVEVKLKVNDSDVTMPIRLIGPGRVAGIDPQQIIRMEPHPGTVDFNPFQFPAVEFDRPDFPWLFTPGQADAKDRLLP